MKYSVIDKNQLFIQEGKDAVKYAMIRKSGYQFIINNSCEYILNEVINNNETDIILEKLKCKFDGTSEDILKKDLDGIINMLLIFHVIESEEISSYNNDFSEYDILCETEYKEASDMIMSKFHSNKYNIGMDPQFYSAMNIRHQIMNNSEYYIRYRDKSNKLKTILSVSPNLNTSVLLINTIVFDEDISFEEACQIFSKILEIAKNAMINRVNKARVIIAETEVGVLPCICKVLEANDFERETILFREIENKAVYFFSKNYM